MLQPWIALLSLWHVHCVYVHVCWWGVRVRGVKVLGTCLQFEKVCEGILIISFYYFSLHRIEKHIQLIFQCFIFWSLKCQSALFFYYVFFVRETNSISDICPIIWPRIILCRLGMDNIRNLLFWLLLCFAWCWYTCVRELCSSLSLVFIMAQRLRYRWKWYWIELTVLGVDNSETVRKCILLAELQSKLDSQHCSLFCVKVRIMTG